MTPKEFVLAKYPLAYAAQELLQREAGAHTLTRTSGWVIKSQKTSSARQLGSGVTEAEAWIVAKSALQPTITEGYDDEKSPRE